MADTVWNVMLMTQRTNCERQTSQAVKTLHTKRGKDRKSTNIPETNFLFQTDCLQDAYGQ